ncbi:hypothetical protein [Nonomuraea sp. NPDC050643]
MCDDDELHGFAQRYLRLAMRLSAPPLRRMRRPSNVTERRRRY